MHRLLLRNSLWLGLLLVSVSRTCGQENGASRSNAEGIVTIPLIPHHEQRRRHLLEGGEIETKVERPSRYHRFLPDDSGSEEHWTDTDRDLSDVANAQQVAALFQGYGVRVVVFTFLSLSLGFLVLISHLVIARLLLLDPLRGFVDRHSPTTSNGHCGYRFRRDGLSLFRLQTLRRSGLSPEQSIHRRLQFLLSPLELRRVSLRRV
jgi:hypothetical protein